MTINTLCKKINAVGGDAIFFVCDIKKNAEKFSAWARTEIAKNLELIKDNVFEFCWVTDYPMFEYNEIDKKIDFSHNPFSMPQIPMDLIDKTDPLELLAYQYDIVCNGIELSSGAIRNHVPELMYKLIKIAGYSKEEDDSKFRFISLTNVFISVTLDIVLHFIILLNESYSTRRMLIICKFNFITF